MISLRYCCELLWYNVSCTSDEHFTAIDLTMCQNTVEPMEDCVGSSSVEILIKYHGEGMAFESLSLIAYTFQTSNEVVVVEWEFRVVKYRKDGVPVGVFAATVWEREKICA